MQEDLVMYLKWHLLLSSSLSSFPLSIYFCFWIDNLSSISQLNFECRKDSDLKKTSQFRGRPQLHILRKTNTYALKIPLKIQCKTPSPAGKAQEGSRLRMMVDTQGHCHLKRFVLPWLRGNRSLILGVYFGRCLFSLLTAINLLS